MNDAIFADLTIQFDVIINYLTVKFDALMLTFSFFYDTLEAFGGVMYAEKESVSVSVGLEGT